MVNLGGQIAIWRVKAFPFGEGGSPQGETDEGSAISLQRSGSASCCAPHPTSLTLGHPPQRAMSST